MKPSAELTEKKADTLFLTYPFPNRQTIKLARLHQATPSRKVHHSADRRQVERSVARNQPRSKWNAWIHHLTPCYQKWYWWRFEGARYAPLGCRDEQYQGKRRGNRFAGGGVRMRVIKELWHGNVCPQTDSRNNSSEMKELMEYIARHHDDLLKTMTMNKRNSSKSSTTAGTST